MDTIIENTIDTIIKNNVLERFRRIEIIRKATLGLHKQALQEVKLGNKIEAMNLYDEVFSMRLGEYEANRILQIDIKDSIIPSYNPNLYNELIDLLKRAREKNAKELEHILDSLLELQAHYQIPL